MLPPPYPVRLLPAPEYDIIEPPDPNHVLCRWVDPDYPLKDGEGKLHALAVDEIRIPTYSLNKIPDSEVDDVRINFHDKDKFLVRWNKGDTAAIVNIGDFFYDQGKYFLIKVGHINEYEYQYPFQNPKNKNEEINYKFKLYVKHEPLIVNYYHFEFHIFDERKGDRIMKYSGNWRKIIIADIRQRLIAIAKFSMNDFD